MIPQGSYIIVVYFFLSFHLYAQPGNGENSARQQFYNLGDFVLESGEKIYDCKIGYRTYGKPNAAKSNIILFPTWFTGTSSTHEQVVPGKLIDTAQYYLMLVDALGNGVSTSPSNSSRQRGLQFPKFSIRDMVESQYLLLTKKLGIQHLYAIAGISMGGSQSFQWAVSRPGFADKIIPIVSSPQNTSYDLLLWRGLLQAIQRDTAYHNGNYTGIPQLHDQPVMWNLVVTTPEKVNELPRENFENWFKQIQTPSAIDWNDMHRQIEAISSHDIAKYLGGSLEKAATMIKAKILIMVANEDHIVNSVPAMQFARLTNSKLVILGSNCGHLSFLCESEAIAKEISTFLGEK